MLSTEILFIGIGQAGNRLVSEVTQSNKRIKGIFINSNEADLKNVQGANERNTLIIAGANGAGRDREEAKKFVIDDRFEIMDEISKYKKKKYIYIVFSMGGGTGSGMSPVLLSLLAKTNPDMKFNVVAILPKLTESRQSLKNACDCWDELVKLTKVNINSIYLLDNSKKETISDVNKEFSTLFNKFLSLPDYEYDEDSVTLDKKEIGNIGNAQGINGIYELDNNYKGDVTEYVSKVMKDSIFYVSAKTCEYLGIVAPIEFGNNEVAETFTVKKTPYICTSEDGDPMLLIGGSTLQNGLIVNMKELVEEEFKNLKEIDEVDIDELLVSVEDPLEKPVKKTKKKAVSIDEIDETDLWNEFLNM